MKSMFFSEILKENNILRNQIEDKEKIKLKILTNITLNQLEPILEYSLNSENIFSEVKIGEYDNIIKESMEISNEVPIIFWELSNISDGFSFKIENFNKNKIKLFKDKVIEDLNLLFDNLRGCKTVVFNKFSHISFTFKNFEKSNFQLFVDDINNYLESNKPENFEIIEIDKLIAINSIEKSFNFRNFYTNKILYTTDFFKSFSIFLHPIIRSLTGKTKKCIVLDCDNTLWSGIIGEDGSDGVKFSIDDIGGGKYFYLVHLLLKSLKEKGVILCLASKNNFSDVEEFFHLNKDNLLLGFDDFIIKKINWNNKQDNIADISKELNIGLDSIIFIDDSDFEINFVKQFLSEVSSFQVPKHLFDYPHLIIDIKNLFYNKNKTQEDLKRSLMYQQTLKRDKTKLKFKNVDDYIKSLKIKIELSIFNSKNIERLSQLTQKTNQFNLSTKRYEVEELINFNNSNNNFLLYINVYDLFGDMGITGLCLINEESNFARIDTFLMSCRILGRKIEYTFLNEVLKYIFEKNSNVKYVVFEYIPSHKNNPIKTFLESTHTKKKKLDNGNSQYIFNKPDKSNKTIHDIIWKIN